MDVFRFRLNCVDHYQASPTKFDPKLHCELGLPSQRHDAYQIPVIRAFGATETGQKVCAHIHGALPYLYLEYEGSLEQDAVDAYIQSLRISIDHALAVSYRRNAYDGRSRFVAHISLVKGVPFFGYHVGYKFFLKIYLLNPLNMTRLADLLQQGAILAKVMQPHESHLQFLLQWMCDYNLYGCAYIDCAKVRFRNPVPDYLEMSNPAHKWHDRSISPELISDEDDVPRKSHCAIEVDVCVQDILNRKEIRQRPIHHDFMERFNHLAPDEKFVHSMAGLWRDETVRRKRRMGITDPSSSPFPPEVLVSMSADPRDTSKGGWIHEEEFREIMARLVDEERYQDGGNNTGFDQFVKSHSRDSEIKTVLESVEDLFPDKLKIFHATQKPRIQTPEDGGNPPAPLVNEESITRVDDADSAYDSDEDRAREIALSQAPPRLDGLTLGSGRRDDEQATDKDEFHPDGEQYGEQFRDSKDPVGSSFDDEGQELTNSDDEFGSFHEDFLGNFDEHPGHKHGSVSVAGKPPKRQKLLHTTEDAFSHANNRTAPSSSPMKISPLKSMFSSRRVTFNDTGHPVEPTGSPRKNPGQDVPASQSSQGSVKAQGSHGPNTLSFPVVKNPHDTDTALRLSQRSGWSNSQNSPRTPKTSSPDKANASLYTPWSNSKSSSSAGSSIATPSSQVIQMAVQLQNAFPVPNGTSILFSAQLPPTTEAISTTMLDCNLQPVIYQDAYYSDERDVPERPREYAGREFKLESNTIPFLPAFDPTGTSPANFGEKPGVVRDKTKEHAQHRRRSIKCSLLNWEFADSPPTYADVENWLKQEKHEEADSDAVEVDVNVMAEQQKSMRTKVQVSQIEGPTQRNKHGFKFSQKQKSTSVNHETQYMSIMSLEVHVNTRGTFLPDPSEDEIAFVSWCVQDDEAQGVKVGVLALSDGEGVARKMARCLDVEVQYEEDELDLINKMVDIVREFDPDILTGYEVHNSSWGYLIERAWLKYEYNLCDEFSRMKTQSHGRFGKEADRWGFTHTSTIRITGRHMINIWRAMRGELNLLQYTMENVVFHLLHKRISHFTHQDLTKWYQSGKPRDLAKVLDYFVSRVQMNLDILEANEIIPRTSEQARLLGVDFFSVISRGSQFKVESLMFRIAKPENFILPSPSRKQVGQQNALECLPLVMEPQSAFYNSPLLVLDFQSLYPSIMIAYNYCYSTFLGRITSWRGQNKMGFTDFQREPRLLELVKDYVNVAPNGMMYVKPEMRKSLLAKMLGEILETRVMVKSGMKVDKDDKTLQQLLNNRQLALKLIANVTYGYTSASFSGRMPCSEIADSIVQTGRETLEKAIALIHSVQEWGAEVVYGDTDSLFVYLPGRTREQAFDIGEKIAAAVTERNPRPVKLKFEKVYHPCVLLAKKRYVGFKYESRNQKEPEFDAKGIETVRRDGTPAEQKIEEKALKLLFQTQDLSQVKRYFQAQCRKIMEGRVNIQDFLFAKEVKLGTYSDRGTGPPGALIATRRMLADPRAEPQYGERVPYVVVTGAPGARLIDRCVAPEVLLADDQLELDAEYYISKNLIPPLERIFNLVGANVRGWFDEMPKVQRVRSVVGDGGVGAGVKKTLENYMQSNSCLICRAKLERPRQPVGTGAVEQSALPLCEICLRKPHTALLELRQRQQRVESRAQDIDAVCRSCEGSAFREEVRCDSRDCPVFYSRVKVRAEVRNVKGGLDGVARALEEKAEGLDW